MSIGKQGQSKDYFRPIGDGTIVRKITQEEYEERKDTERGLVRKREWSAGDKSGISYEEVYRSVSGRIVAINFSQHDEMGQGIEVSLRTNDGEEGVFAVNTSSPYGQTLMEALPSVDLEREVTLTAWSKEKDGKTRKVIFVSQYDEDEDKEVNVPNYYREWNEKKKEFKNKHGYPEVNEKEKAKYKDKYWRTRYFPEVEIFLVEQMESEVIPNLKQVETTEVVYDKQVDDEDDEL